MNLTRRIWSRTSRQLLFASVSLTLLCAVSPEPAPAPEAPAAPTKPAAGAKRTKKKLKGSRSGEKEIEGTQAPNSPQFRNSDDNVVKSQYRLNGEPLEVDPD